jgi:hypothetical protein
MERLAQSVKTPGKVYFTGGATALLLGFRQQTIDVDVKLDPEPAGAFEAIAIIKNEMDINVELAAPSDFIPESTRWRERSKLIKSIGPIDFYHFDFTLQALAKLERGHKQDINDVKDFVSHGYTDAQKLRSTFAEIEPRLIRYPAINPMDFKKKVEDFLNNLDQ